MLESAGQPRTLASAASELRSLHEALAESARALQRRHDEVTAREAAVACREAAVAVAESSAAQQPPAPDEPLLRALLAAEASRLSARGREALEARAGAHVERLERVASLLKSRHEELERRRAKLAACQAATSARLSDPRAARPAPAALPPPPPAAAADSAAALREKALQGRLERSRALATALLLPTGAAAPLDGASLDDAAFGGAVDLCVSLPLDDPAAVAAYKLLWGAAGGGAAGRGTADAADAPPSGPPPARLGARPAAQWERRLVRHLSDRLAPQARASEGRREARPPLPSSAARVRP